VISAYGLSYAEGISRKFAVQDSRQNRRPHLKKITKAKRALLVEAWFKW
jgi:hypothetical protein